MIKRRTANFIKMTFIFGLLLVRLFEINAIVSQFAIYVAIYIFATMLFNFDPILSIFKRVSD